MGHALREIDYTPVCTTFSCRTDNISCCIVRISRIPSTSATHSSDYISEYTSYDIICCIGWRESEERSYIVSHDSKHLYGISESSIYLFIVSSLIWFRLSWSGYIWESCSSTSDDIHDRVYLTLIHRSIGEREGEKKGWSEKTEKEFLATGENHRFCERFHKKKGKRVRILLIVAQ